MFTASLGCTSNIALAAPIRCCASSPAKMSTADAGKRGHAVRKTDPYPQEPIGRTTMRAFGGEYGDPARRNSIPSCCSGVAGNKLLVMRAVSHGLAGNAVSVLLPGAVSFR